MIVVDTRDSDVPFVALRFFNEGRDIGVLCCKRRERVIKSPPLFASETKLILRLNVR
jgi:hypothetical protein